MSKFEVYEPAEDSFLMSETLEEVIPILLAKNFNLKFLEIGAGSAVQLQTALRAGIKKENILGVDINNEAVKKCKKLGFKCINSNLFSRVKGKFDIIVFNPPYLPEDTREPKESSVATTGGKKGGEIVNKFLKQAKKHLAREGKIILLISTLTKGINFLDYEVKSLAERKLFFEKLQILELSFSG